MTTLLEYLAEYLELRRGLGFKLADPGRVLPKFIEYLHAHGQDTVRTELAVAWAREPATAQPIHWAHRLSAVRGFARYLQTIIPETEIPPEDVFGARQQRITPYYWTSRQITDMLALARTLTPETKAVTYATVYGLIAVTGMRVGETLAIGRQDVDTKKGIIILQDTKYDQPRILPVDPSVSTELASYIRFRDQHFPEPHDTTFFLTHTGHHPSSTSIDKAFREITTQMGIRTDTVHPRIHDLRHSYAINVLIDCYRNGGDLDLTVARLSTYLGHVSPQGTYWYLSASPELMQLAAARLNKRNGGPL